MTEDKFANLDIKENILSALTEHKFINCTPIQTKALPIVLSGHDIIAQSQTGTGKTLTFLTATYNYLELQNHIQKNSYNQPRALILAPTRELAFQIKKDSEIFNSHTNYQTAILVGGEPIEQQKQTIAEGADIIIGTCGRVIDFIKQNLIDLSLLDVVVLDEADRMLDLGFIKDIRYIFKQTPPPSARLTMLFSATISYKVKEIAYQHMKAHEFISTNTKTIHNSLIDEELFYPSNEHKMDLLQTLIEEDWPEKAIIFSNTKIKCEEIYSYLIADKHRVGLLTGDIPQKKRTQTLENFAKGYIDILVATDVAARGLHIPSVSHVYNYDLPDDPEDYVHRIGRTGRAGEAGKSISFACEAYAINLPNIEELIKHSLPVTDYDQNALIKNLPKPSNKRNNFDKKITNKTQTQFNKNRRRKNTNRYHAKPNK